MAVEYEISSDVATIKDVAPNTQVARVVSLYSGQITYDDEAGSKFATATIDGKSQRVMLCIAVNGTVNYDDVPCLYSTVDGHRCLNIVSPTETGMPDDVPSVYETVVIDGKNVRAVRCVLINATPIYDGVSSTCTFVENGKTHTAQLVNEITGGGAIEVIVRGTSPISLPDAIANSLEHLKAFGGTEQRNLPEGYTQLEYLQTDGSSYIDTGVVDLIGNVYELNVLPVATTSIDRYQMAGANNGININVINLKWQIATTETTASVDFNNFQKLIAERTPTARNLTINGETFAASAGSNTTLNFFIGKVDGFDIETASPIPAKFSNCKIFADNVLVRNLIPAKRNSDNVLGMYDLVSGQFFTNAGTGTFTAGADVAPSPTTPMDIVCNNGVVKVKNLLDVSQNIIYRDTNYTDLIHSNGKISYTNTATVGFSQYVGVYFVATVGKEYTISFTQTDALVRVFESDVIKTTVGTDYGDVISSGYTFTATKKYVYIYVVVSMGQTGSAENIQVEEGSTATPYLPYGQVYADGTTETVDVFGGNIFTTTDATSGSYIAADGRISGAPYFSYTALIEARPNTVYTFSGGGSTYETSNRRLHAYNSNGDWLAEVAHSTSDGTTYSASGTTPANTAYLRLSFVTDDTDVKIQYYGGTATAEMLLKVGNYEDVQSIIDGVVTRNVGVKVFDGTENWNIHASGAMGSSIPHLQGDNNMFGYCSHFLGVQSSIPVGDLQIGQFKMTATSDSIYFKTEYDTTAAWQQWLADQYAAGNPVIIVYPLATPTAESVAGQAMRIQQGDNVVEITQASLSNLELEVKYKKQA